jgi:hypothetical protein
LDLISLRASSQAKIRLKILGRNCLLQANLRGSRVFHR